MASTHVMPRPRFVLVTLLTLVACLASIEIARRLLDGYYVWRAALVKNPHSTDLTWSQERSADALLNTIDLDPEADRSWFYERPPAPQSTIGYHWADARRADFEAQANYVWNVTRIGDIELRDYLKKFKGRLDDIFTFRPPNHSPFPVYRLYPDIQSGFGRTNEFGWRSGPIEREKPPNVIRIGFMGDSTTNEYPALVEHWLNHWSRRRRLGVRFEVMNAARPATGALDAAAILEFELAPADPDYVIVYGFGNGIHVAEELIKLPPGILLGRPMNWTAPAPSIVSVLSTRAATELEPAARWSAAAGFLRDRLSGRHGEAQRPEPPKPATELRFPPGLDEASPDLDTIASDKSQGIMRLEAYVQALNKMDALAKAQDIRLFVSTFRILAFDGMRAGGNLYHTLNEDYWWPYTYAQIRRLMTFYNRTLRTWAERHGQSVLDIDERMPWRPELYGDGMHERAAGEALHAWIVLQQLMPRIRADLAKGVVPRPARPPHADVGAYWTIERVSVSTIID